ncbi:MAG: GTP-binding protein [Lachnospiraceae bacterium]|jgi:ribosomal protection tetracycline resistance protein
MRKTFGVLAHVDGGKTTFSEQLLYHAGAIRKAGRVDQKNTLLDGDEVEKARGITIYADQSWFEYQGDEYYLLDTPGHVDFSAETERAATVLDYAILLIDASSDVAAHTVTLFRMLERFQVPVFLFLNKTDLEHADVDLTMKEIRDRLTKDAVLVENWPCGETDLESLTEFAAERDEGIMEAYLEGSPIEKDRLFGALRTIIRERRGVLCMKGSALNNQGIDQFFQAFHELTESRYEEDKPFSGLVYKVRHDEKGQRITFLKVLSGVLKNRDEVRIAGKLESENQTAETEKIHEIRLYSGQQSQTAASASAGSLCAVTGLSVPVCQDVLVSSGDFSGQEQEISHMVYWYGKRKNHMQMRPALQAQVTSGTTDSHTLFRTLKMLEEEEPQLLAESREDKSLVVSVMGKIQLEVLAQVLKDRFGIEAVFAPPKVLYRETIARAVMGFGHYEPLRHYAEVHLRLEPAKRDSGISFSSECHVDTLAVQYQSLVRTHVFERVHKGILTGSPLTDIRIVLTAGKAHLKHTEGGDFREAVYRAIRQGLEKAENVLLEPWYQFEISAPDEYAGKIMADIQKRSGEFAPPMLSEDMVSISGRGPVASFMDYGIELAAQTQGRGSISMIWGGYRECHNPEEVIADCAYNKGADKENPSSSVFCSHGAGFVVNWNEVEQYIHLPAEKINENRDDGMKYAGD